MDPIVRYRPFFDNLELKVEQIAAVMPHAYQRSEYAGVAGAEFDDMGPQGKVFSVKAWFFKDNYHDYSKFIDAAEQPDAVHNFVHPDLGLLFGVVTSINDTIDSKKATVEVTFVFEEQLQGNFEEQITPLILPQIESTVQDGQKSAVSALESTIVATLGSDAVGVGATPVDSTKNLTSQFITASGSVRAYVSRIDAAMAVLNRFLSDVAQPANTLISSIDYGVTLPGLFIRAIASAIDRYASLIDVTISAPYNVIQSFFNGLHGLRASLSGFEVEFDAVRAQMGALLTAQLFAADDAARNQAKIIDKTSAWTHSGEYVGKPERPSVMSVSDLERVTTVTRTYLQQAITNDRSNEIHAAMAAALLRQVNVVKIDRERVIAIDVSDETSLVLLCHKYGLGYSAADRVLSINPDIKNPSFVRGEVAMYAR